MAFSSSITTLLETYSNCLSLLRAFKCHGRNSVLGPEEQRARLRKSLKSDRALVERAYSARLSEAGSRFEKGDARAISVLDRILNKLRAAIASLLRLSSKKQQPGLDYNSLKSLSNASRIDAINAIDRLSRRLGSPSQTSVMSYKLPSQSHIPSTSPRHQRHPSSSFPASTPTSLRHPKTRSDESIPKKKSDRDEKTMNTTKKPKSERSPKDSPKPSERSQNQPRSNPQQAPILNRISIISSSTNSTKLGEIPEKRWRSRYPVTGPSSSDGYNVPILYPLKPYTTEVREKRFLGLFRRKEKRRPDID
ncbi:hypothetical protein B0T17DRAFT_485601 [Bombardia bombarda]|uniref:Uncharacterized protein n=1 Tax=Bombardia bombarda TaxID=252184 RepID=A0AA40CFE7_9PEZI|nr:hypothetical protein B0T17DRAFT_485601 [Bombardia bombarda]